MQPSTRDWTRFMYTLGSWLIPRGGDGSLMEIMQPVGRNRSDVWTDNIEECIQWFLSGEKKGVFNVQAAKDTLLQARAAKKAKRRSGAE